MNVDIDDLDELIIIDKRIDAAEDHAADSLRESLRDRWEFGQLMLAKRKGKQLPKGMLDAMAEAIGKSRSELKYRMQFAERYPTENELANAVGQFPSWKQVIRSLPKPPPENGSPSIKPTPAPKADRPEVEEKINEFEDRGVRYSAQDVVDALEDSDIGIHTVARKRRAVQAAREAAAEAAPVAWETIPGNQQVKLERAKRSMQRQLDKEYQARLLAELDQHRAKLDSDFAAHKAAYDAQNAAVKAMRDDERRRYKEGIEVYRAKGLITPDEYNVIRSCLHPDSRASVTDEKLAAAFRLFNDSRIRTLLVKEI
jgi:hypothetical protein